LCEKKKKTLYKFLNDYDVFNSGIPHFSEINVLRTTGNTIENSRYEWIKVDNIKLWIQIGLYSNACAFSVYYSVKGIPVTDIIISFTIDNNLIFGLRMPDNDYNYKYVQENMFCYRKAYSGISIGLFDDSEIPALSKIDFINSGKRAILWHSVN
jgi:hypothetical protein